MPTAFRYPMINSKDSPYFDQMRQAFWYHSGKMLRYIVEAMEGLLEKQLPLDLDSVFMTQNL